MIYILVLIFVCCNFYALDKTKYVKSPLAFAVFTFPSFMALVLLPALQNGIGADYHAYMDIYHGDVDELNRFLLRGEYLFYYLFSFIIDNKLGEQTIFVLSSFFNMLALFIFLYWLKCRDVKLCFVVFCFLVVTNIFHNQMNGIRQYMGLMLFPIMYLLLIEKKLFLYFLLSIFATFFHTTAIVGFLLFPLSILFNRLPRRSCIILFFISLFFYLLSTPIVSIIVENYFKVYIHYLTSDYGAGLPVSSMLTRLYYLPVFLFFLYVYFKTANDDKYYSKNLGFGIFVWSVTYWTFTLYISFGFFYRISVYYFIFYIFPLYYLYNYLSIVRKYGWILVLLVYLLLPYFLKVVVFSKGVFLYDSIIF